MRKFDLILVIILVATTNIHAQDSNQQPELPELHAIRMVTLSPSYSCRSSAREGYAKTALFLTAYFKRQNSPDLLFNGACGSDDYFQAATAGDDMSLVADLGLVSLEEVSAARAFNLKRVHSPADNSKFAQTAKVELNHSYAVLLNGRDKRGLLLFTVVGYVPNQKVELRYTVKSYQIITNYSVSQGFDWEKRSK
ncbi:MAG TPA: hypothetical protein VJS64_10735 [Pyrinomonadaceae bacterium]|nr:hypothetical protein [Pyrinomonadaceae bacterium]